MNQLLCDNCKRSCKKIAFNGDGLMTHCSNLDYSGVVTNSVLQGQELSIWDILAMQENDKK